MKTRQDRATQIYVNALDLGCGFKYEGDDHVIVLSPTFDGKGQPHGALQNVIDRYQPEFCQLVPRHGVRPDRLRPATTESITAHKPGDRLALIGNGIEGARKNAAKKASMRRGKRPVARPATSGRVRRAVPDERMTG